MPSIIKIKNKFIGENQPVFIIAEVGVNHNGSLVSAKKLIDVAKDAGADAVKFQTFQSEELAAENTPKAHYQKEVSSDEESQLEMLKRMELSHGDFIELKKYCDEKEIIFLSTPYTMNAVDFLKNLVPAYKISSGDITNLPFLEKIAENKKPVILSTGMASMAEVKVAVKNLKKYGDGKIIILHCTTNYPCPVEEVNLRAMLTLKKEFKLPIGYSDHTQGFLAPIVAVAMGAKIIEKHFTLDKKLAGPDHKASLRPEELKEMVSVIRETEMAMGSSIKKPTKSERAIMKAVRKSVIARKDIIAGQKITDDMLIIKRPGNGIEPKYFNKIIGRKAKKNIKKESLISWKQLS